MNTGNCSARGLVDTGCTKTIVHSKLVDGCTGETFIGVFDGSQVKCKGSTVVHLVIDNRPLSLHAVVSD